MRRIQCFNTIESRANSHSEWSTSRVAPGQSKALVFQPCFTGHRANLISKYFKCLFSAWSLSSQQYGLPTRARCPKPCLGNLNSWKASTWGKVGPKAIGHDTGILSRDRDNQCCWDDSNKIVGERRFRALYQELVHIKIWDGPFLSKKTEKNDDDWWLWELIPANQFARHAWSATWGITLLKQKNLQPTALTFAVQSYCDVLLASSRVFSRALGEAI